MKLPLHIEDIALFFACFGLNAGDLAYYILEDEEVFS